MGVFYLNKIIMTLLATRTLCLRNLKVFSTSIKCSASLHSINFLHCKPLNYQQITVSHQKSKSNTIQSIRNYAEETKFFDIFTKGRNKADLNLAALSTLNEIYMKAPQKELREHCGLEDSFVIWFNMVTIHVWMVGVRLAREGNDGKILFESMLSMLWEDVEERLKKFEGLLKRNFEVKKRLKKYYREVNLYFHLLDEGLLGSDSQLASSLWTILKFKNQDLKAWHLEMLVHYIRSTTSTLDRLDFDEIIENPSIISFQFKKHVFD